MDIMTHAKFHFNRLMFTLILASGPLSRPQAWRKTEKAGPDRVKPGLHIIGRIVGMCLRPCPKEHITVPQVLIAKISCERLLLSKTCIAMWKKLPLNRSCYPH